MSPDVALRRKGLEDNLNITLVDLYMVGLSRSVLGSVDQRKCSESQSLSLKKSFSISPILCCRKCKTMLKIDWPDLGPVYISDGPVDRAEASYTTHSLEVDFS